MATQIPHEYEMFDKLKQVSALSAIWDSETEQRPKCYDGTRVKLLSELDAAVGPGTSHRKLVWLSGRSGSGKTAVAQTLAERLHHEGRLAATFFFSSNHTKQDNVDHFCTTISYQLGLQQREAKRVIVKAITEDSGLLSPEKSLSDKFQKLVIQPLKSIRLRPDWKDSSKVLLVDALNEAQATKTRTDQFKPIINMLLELVRNPSLPKLHVIVTSTAWKPIMTLLTKPNLSAIVQRKEMQDYHARHDIAQFLRGSFSDIRDEFELPVNSNDTSWPSEADLNLLIKRSNAHFIFAATIIRQVAIDDPEGSLVTLCKMLRGDPVPEISTLNQLYSSILDMADTYSDNAHFCPSRHLPAIVNMAETLPCQDLCQLLSVKVDTLQRLSAVLHVPSVEHEHVQIHHPSLRDYLNDASKSGKLHELPTLVHCKISRACFRFMERVLLKKDVCNLGDPTKLHDEIIDFQEKRKLISPALRYSCLHWAHHLRCAFEQPPPEAQDQLSLVHEKREELQHLLLDFLQKRLLFAIEVHSITGSLGSAVEIFQRAHKVVQTWPKSKDSDIMLDLLYDARRFVLEFFDCISVSALHVYNSALVLCPEKTRIREVYQNFLSDLDSKTISTCTGLDTGWGRVRRVITTKSIVYSITVSPDGSKIAASVGDGMHIWSTSTGLLLASPSKTPCCHAKFSPDASLLVLCNRDIRATSNKPISWALYDGVKGSREFLQPTMNGSFHDCAFSPDGRTIACGFTEFINADAKCAMWLWDTSTSGQAPRCLSIPNIIGNIIAMSFSTPKEVIVQTDRAISIISTSTGDLLLHQPSIDTIRELDGFQPFLSPPHDADTNSSQLFSLNGDLVVYVGSDPSDLRVHRFVDSPFESERPFHALIQYIRDQYLCSRSRSRSVRSVFLSKRLDYTPITVAGNLAAVQVKDVKLSRWHRAGDHGGDYSGASDAISAFHNRNRRAISIVTLPSGNNPSRAKVVKSDYNTLNFSNRCRPAGVVAYALGSTTDHQTYELIVEKKFYDMNRLHVEVWKCDRRSQVGLLRFPTGTSYKEESPSKPEEGNIILVFSPPDSANRVHDESPVFRHIPPSTPSPAVSIEIKRRSQISQLTFNISESENTPLSVTFSNGLTYYAEEHAHQVQICKPAVVGVTSADLRCSINAQNLHLMTTVFSQDEKRVVWSQGRFNGSGTPTIVVFSIGEKRRSKRSSGITCQQVASFAHSLSDHRMPLRSMGFLAPNTLWLLAVTSSDNSILELVKWQPGETGPVSVATWQANSPTGEATGQRETIRHAFVSPSFKHIYASLDQLNTLSRNQSETYASAFLDAVNSFNLTNHTFNSMVEAGSKSDASSGAKHSFSLKDVREVGRSLIHDEYLKNVYTHETFLDGRAQGQIVFEHSSERQDSAGSAGSLDDSQVLSLKQYRQLEQTKQSVQDFEGSISAFDVHTGSEMWIDRGGWLRTKQQRVCWLPHRYRPRMADYLKLPKEEYDSLRAHGKMVIVQAGERCLVLELRDQKIQYHS